LFVADHPYFCRTDFEGRFTLEQVPEGRYELVCWHPNWHERSHDRDPESALIQRLYFAEPLELVRQIEVPAVGRNVLFTLDAGAFPGK
jgi:hypothetical protein